MQILECNNYGKSIYPYIYQKLRMDPASAAAHRPHFFTPSESAPFLASEALGFSCVSLLQAPWHRSLEEGEVEENLCLVTGAEISVSFWAGTTGRGF